MKRKSTVAQTCAELPEDGISLGAIECEAIRRALEHTDGNVSRAARFLRVTRQTLIYRMKKHGLEGTESEDSR